MFVNPFWLGFLVGFMFAIILVLVVGGAMRRGGDDSV